MKVVVTKRHIQAGKLKDPRQCAIALAVLEQEKAEYVAVGAEIYVGRKNTIERYNLPKIAVDFMKAFDKGKSCKPVSFTTRKLKDA